jgi:ubiquinone/menaquinone biosynthesis C-methylase UbiE
MSLDSVWRDPAIVEEYSHATELQAPEQAILNLLQDQLPQMKMLDLGVGGGRTTLHFAQQVKNYMGVDYSAEMIAACKARFQPASEKISFAVCDARTLDIFPDRYFDFILFSYNGIDCVAHADRLRVLQQVHRVGRRGGFFCFSAHNLQSRQQVDLPFESGCGFAVINDGVHDGRLQLYYIRPDEQLQQLRPYFTDIRVYNLAGNLVQDHQLNSISDCWLYYSCTIR